MKKLPIFLLVFLFLSAVSYGFNVSLNRDPFIDLVEERQMEQQEAQLELKKRSIATEVLLQKVNLIKSSLKVLMVVVSPEDPNLKVCLIQGKSGIPIVVKKNQKLSDGVYVKNIRSNGVDLLVTDGKQSKTIFIKLR